MDDRLAELFATLREETNALESECTRFLSVCDVCDGSSSKVDSSHRNDVLPHSSPSQLGRSPDAPASRRSMEEGTEEPMQEHVDLCWAKDYFSQLVRHVRLVLESSASAIRPYEGFLWGEKIREDGKGHNEAVVSLLNAILEALNALRVIRKTIWSVLPAPLQLVPHSRNDNSTGSKMNERKTQKNIEISSTLHNVEGGVCNVSKVGCTAVGSHGVDHAQRHAPENLTSSARLPGNSKFHISDEEALRTALLLRSVTLFHRDIYLLLSFCGDFTIPLLSRPHLDHDNSNNNSREVSPPLAIALPPTPCNMSNSISVPDYSQLRQVAQGLTLLRQGHHPVLDPTTFAQAMASLLLPYTPARDVLRKGSTMGNVKQQEQEQGEQPLGVETKRGKEMVALLSLDASVYALYRLVLHYTKEIYKAESRISLFVYQLLQEERPMERLGKALFSLAHGVMEEFDVVRGAKNDIQLGILHAFSGEYELSAKRSQKALGILSCLSIEESRENPKDKSESVSSLIHSPYLTECLQSVALFNLACVKHILFSRDFFRQSAPVRISEEGRESIASEEQSHIQLLFWKAYEHALTLAAIESKIVRKGSSLFSLASSQPLGHAFVQALVNRLGGSERLGLWKVGMDGTDLLRQQRINRSSEDAKRGFANTCNSAADDDPVEKAFGVEKGEGTLVGPTLSVEGGVPPPASSLSSQSRLKQRVTPLDSSPPFPIEEIRRGLDSTKRWSENSKECSTTNLIPLTKPLKPPHHLPRATPLEQKSTSGDLLSSVASLHPTAPSEDYLVGSSSMMVGSVTIPPPWIGTNTAEGKPKRTTSFPISSAPSSFVHDSKEGGRAASIPAQGQQGLSPVGSHPTPTSQGEIFSCLLPSYTHQQKTKRNVELKLEKNGGICSVGISPESRPQRPSSFTPSWRFPQENRIEKNEKAAESRVAAPSFLEDKVSLSSSQVSTVSKHRVTPIPPPLPRDIPFLSTSTSKKWSLSSAERGVPANGYVSLNGIKKKKRSTQGVETGSESTGGSGAGGSRTSIAYKSFTSFYQRTTKSTSVSSVVLSCHRLERPDDALLLAGPKEDFVPPDKAKEEELEKEKKEELTRKRERRIRSFLPEDIERKQKKKEERVRRQEKRERHEKKKKYFAKRQRQTAEQSRRNSKKKSSVISLIGFRHYSNLQNDHSNEVQGRQGSFFEFEGSYHSQDLSIMGKDRKGSKRVEEGKGSSLGEEKVAEIWADWSTAAGSAASTASGGAGRRKGNSLKNNRQGREWVAEEGRWREENEGIADGGSVYHSRTASEGGTQNYKRGRRQNSSFPLFSGDEKYVQKRESLLKNQKSTSDEISGEDVEEDSEDSAAFSSLSSHSLPLSSLADTDMKEEDDDDETVEERKERYNIEMQLYFFGTHRKREKAAHVIQRAWRCSVARLELYNRRQYFYQQLYIRQKAAALCIAGFMKCRLLRERLKKWQCERAKNDTLRLQLERREMAAVQIIERTFIRYWTNKLRRAKLREELNLVRDAQLSQYEVAAIIVQRWWRIIPSIRAYWVQRGVEVRQQREAEELEAARTSAAIQIQALVRGRQARRYCRRYRLQRSRERLEKQEKLIWSTELVKLSLTEWCLRAKRLEQAARIEEERESEAVKRITQGWQAALSNRRFQLAVTKARQIRVAAETIQRSFKRFYAGRERRYLREIVITAERERIDHEFLVYRATIKLQSFARVVLAKAAYRRQRARYGRGVAYALMVLQSVGRGYLSRAQFNSFRLATYEERRLEEERAIQMWNRHRDVMEGFILGKASAVLKERKACDRLTNKLFIRLLVRRELNREKAAVKIQRAYRHYIGWKRAFIKEYQERCAEEAALMAVVRIQSAWRQWKARGELRKKRWLAFKVAQKRGIQEEVLAGQWVINIQYFMREFEQERRRITNLESDIRDHLLWKHQKGLRQISRADGAMNPLFLANGGKNYEGEDDDDLPPMNVTVALEGMSYGVAAEGFESWCALYSDE